MSDRDGKRMAVYGRSGSGKTHLVKSTFLNVCDRVVIFDPEEEFAKEKGFHTVRTLEKLLEVLSDCHDSSFKVVFVPEVRMEERQLHEVSLLIERLQEPYKEEMSNKKLMLIVDELSLSFPLNSKPAYDGFDRLCSRGRKRGISIIGITQRPADIGMRFRGNLNRIVAFNFSTPNDLAVIAATCGQEAVSAVRELKQYQYIAYENGAFTVNGP